MLQGLCDRLAAERGVKTYLGDEPLFAPSRRDAKNSRSSRVSKIGLT
jgi:hypothetical protein